MLGPSFVSWFTHLIERVVVLGRDEYFVVSGKEE